MNDRVLAPDDRDGRRYPLNALLTFCPLMISLGVAFFGVRLFLVFLGVGCLAVLRGERGGVEMRIRIRMRGGGGQ